MRALAFALLLVFSLAARANESTELELTYGFSENCQTVSDHRSRSTNIYLSGGNRLHYQFSEDVGGSITPRVESLRFKREKVLTTAEKRELIESLLEAKVFDLAVDDGSDYRVFAVFVVRIGGRQAHFRCKAESLPPAAQRIHECLLAFAKRTKVDQPADTATALTVTEGDQEPVREVKFADLLRSPAAYHGKRVAVVGFIYLEFEGNRLCAARQHSTADRSKPSIAWGGASSFVENPDWKETNFIWARVEGIFLRGPSGHLGGWPGQITRITCVEPVSR